MFLDYRHNSSEATDVTFNLKDFKAVLVLCEGLGTNVAICFDQPGSPLLVQPVFHSSNPLVRWQTVNPAANMYRRGDAVLMPSVRALGTNVAVSLDTIDVDQSRDPSALPSLVPLSRSL